MLPDLKAIELKGLSYIYSKGSPFEKKALDDINLEIEQGDFIGIIGHTGSGKSTLMQHLNGLLKPDMGEVYINGRNIWDKNVNIRSVRFEVGLVFQYSEYQLFEESVAKDIAFGPKNMGLSSDEVEKRVKEAAEMVGISEEILQRSPFELSGGQKRRAALAGILAMQPKILVLDEPAAGLDPIGRDMILEQIKNYHEKYGTTILLVSHSMEDIVKYAKKVLVMNKAKIFCFDDTDKVFARSDEIEAMGLSVPQITRICRSLASRGINLGDDIYTIERAKERFDLYVKNLKGFGENA